jgi:hypothetical protein
LQDSGPLHHLFLSKYRASLDPKLISLCLHSLVFFLGNTFCFLPKKGFVCRGIMHMWCQTGCQ